jgi:hypothetical protein
MHLGVLFVGRSIVDGILAAIDFFCLLLSYAVLRVLRISVHWITLFIGGLIAAAAVYACYTLLTPNPTGQGLSNTLGALSFLIAIFAIGQWLWRRWYLLAKSTPVRFVARASRGFFLYLRDHHRFFGWLVVLTATAHAVLLLPVIDQVSRTEVVTGVIALVLLAVLTGLGEWIELTVRHKRASRNLRWLHTALAIAFLAAFAVHA